jgi:hypothetical protein
MRRRWSNPSFKSRNRFLDRTGYPFARGPTRATQLRCGPSRARPPCLTRFARLSWRAVDENSVFYQRPAASTTHRAPDDPASSKQRLARQRRVKRGWPRQRSLGGHGGFVPISRPRCARTSSTTPNTSATHSTLLPSASMSSAAALMFGGDWAGFMGRHCRA